MATTDHMNTSTPDERAWEVFFEALDPESCAAAAIPSGAAIVPADSDNLDELKRRYQAGGRPVVLVDADGKVRPVKSRPVDVGLIAMLGAAAVFVWRRLRSVSRIPA
jgi:hypothetical protein